jgi:serine/threonine protein kinase
VVGRARFARPRAGRAVVEAPPWTEAGSALDAIEKPRLIVLSSRVRVNRIEEVMASWERLEQDAVIGGAYRIVRLLGRGGAGEVYEALHLRTGASLAIKILRADFNGKTEALQRFQREAEVTSRLHHPNIVKVFDFDCLPDGRPYLVMELLSGKDLGRILRSKEALPPERLLAIVDQVASALATTHGAGVVHRDLSPGNIFIEQIPGSDRELIRVLDFGISKVRDTIGALTHTTTIMGTPYYMSPEQAQGHAKETDSRADQFALAAIVYEMLTRRQAFASDDPLSHDPATAILYRVVHHDPPSFAALNLDLPPALEDVVRKGLAKDPAQRYPSVLDFSDALAKAAWQAGFGEPLADSGPGFAPGQESSGVTLGGGSYNSTLVRRRRVATGQVRTQTIGLPPRTTELIDQSTPATLAPPGLARSAAPWFRSRRTAVALGALVLLGGGAAALLERSHRQSRGGASARPAAPSTPGNSAANPPIEPPAKLSPDAPSNVEPRPGDAPGSDRRARKDERAALQEPAETVKRKKSYHPQGNGRSHSKRPPPRNEDIY